MCWSNHRAARDHWSREITRREPASRTDVRVSDAERDEVVEQLSRHTGEGRLTLEEFEQRVEEAFNSKTRGDLDATLRGLPRVPQRASRRRSDLRVAYRAVMAVALVAIAVVAAGPWILFFVVPVAMCRVRGFHDHGWYEVDQPRSDRDELTVV